jgi:coenzyme F420-reducing hydrogenase delta subunit/NAD-dependent dihydropyrimidine dehydrogenase PreA subunit
MCTGRVDLSFVLRAFLNGMDGVLIGGCRLNECNYVTHGNYHALNMALLCRRIMESIGLNPERLRIEFMSAAEGILFTEVVNSFGKRVEELGPLGQGEGLDRSTLTSDLEKVTQLIPYLKLVNRDKLASHLDQPADYKDLFTLEEVERLFREVVSYYIDPEKCQACMICLKKCPVEAIAGGKNQIHVIDQAKCIKCGTCFDACPSRFGAVRKISGEAVPPPPPEAERIIDRKSKKPSALTR